MNRATINPKHVSIGEGYRLLNDDETLKNDDQTICISEIRALGNAYQWRKVPPEWTNQNVLTTLKDDADGFERIFRRRI